MAHSPTADAAEGSLAALEAVLRTAFDHHLDPS